MQTLEDKYQQILKGYNFTTPELEIAKYELEWCLHDLNACLKCQGDNCKTRINRGYERHMGKEYVIYKGNQKYYYALNYFDSKDLSKPMFRLVECPGAVRRKEEIKEKLFSGRR